MLLWFFILFILIPLADFMLLVKVSGIVTIPATIGIVLLTGVVGAALARRQGLRTLVNIQQEMRAGRLPASELGEGMLILVAAVLLMTPGFITDFAGFLLLIPPVRRFAMIFATRYLKSHIVIQRFGTAPEGFDGGSSPSDQTVGPPNGLNPFDLAGGGPRPRRYVRNEAMGAAKPSNPNSELE